ncbi:uncharacterized protein LOC143190054 isoform X2 [Rhynchophorus ferrugineus]|uniref:Uncharacterized protein n=1 Tax=Rhynchophorus ferrugineus TaxID=354439 RepID=A0A834I4U9_RHYFE|nr:hypothetical protein GWI33_014929 [Rhynchophorus ferrugineus]
MFKHLFIISLCVVYCYSTVLRCDLIDPHSKESELCWRQLLYKIKPLSQVTSESAMEETTLQTRNAELSNLLMEMFKSDKTNGKRNPDLSANVLKYMTDWSQYKGN